MEEKQMIQASPDQLPVQTTQNEIGLYQSAAREFSTKMPAVPEILDQTQPEAGGAVPLLIEGGKPGEITPECTIIPLMESKSISSGSGPASSADDKAASAENLNEISQSQPESVIADTRDHSGSDPDLNLSTDINAEETAAKEEPAPAKKTELIQESPVTGNETKQKSSPVSEEPVMKTERIRDILKVSLRKDVCSFRSILKWNGSQTESRLFRLQEGKDNLLTYELCNEKGEILASDEQSFSFRDLEDFDADLDGNYLALISRGSLHTGRESEKEEIQVYVDGALQPAGSEIELTNENRTLEIRKKDDLGIESSTRYEIRQAAVLEGDPDHPETMLDENNVLNLRLKGDWKNMSIRIICDSDQTQEEIPFSSDCLSVPLQAGQSYTIVYSGRYCADETRFQISVPESGQTGLTDPRDKENSENSDSAGPEAVPDQTQTADRAEDKKHNPAAERIPSDSVSGIQTAAGPLMQTVPPSGQSAVDFAEQKTSYEKLNVPLKAETFLISSPLEQLKFDFTLDGVSVENRKPAEFLKESHVSWNIENGNVRKAQFSNSLTETVYSSFEEARKADPEGIIEARFQLEDLYGKEKLSSYTLVPDISEASAVYEMENGSLLSKFSLDEDGSVCSELVRFVNLPGQICKGLEKVEQTEIHPGDELRIYLNIPAEKARVTVNSEPLQITQVLKDELGLEYVPLKAADQEMKIEIASSLSENRTTARITPVSEKAQRKMVQAVSHPGQNRNLVSALLQSVSAVGYGLFLQRRRRLG